MAAAISFGPRSYTARRTQVASTSTTCDTHAPRATAPSAARVCAASSLVISLTRTFVSTLRMTANDGLRNAGFQVRQGPPPRRCRKQRLMHVFRRVAANTADHHVLAAGIPFEHRAGTQPELAAHRRRHG